MGKYDAGSQHGESCPWQRSWGRGPGKRKGRIRSQGCPLDFPEHLPPQPPECMLYCAMLSTYSSDITGGYPRPPFSRKSLLRAAVNSLLHIKGLSHLRSLWWLSNLPDRFIRTFTITHVIVHSLPTTRGMGSLKRLKDIEPFKELRIILVKDFIVELMIAARPPYPLSFRHLGGY